MSELRRPSEWDVEYDMVVLDPDGWRSGRHSGGPKSWDEPISREEFEQRRMESTLTLRRDRLSMSQSCSDCGRVTHFEDDFGRVCGQQIGVEQYCEGMFN